MHTFIEHTCRIDRIMIPELNTSRSPLERAKPDGQPETLLCSSPSTLRKGAFYVIGRPCGVEYATPLPAEPSWVNEYTAFVTKQDEAGEQRLQKNLVWLFEQLGTAVERVCMSRMAPSSIPMDDLKAAEAFWPIHQNILHIVHPEIIITYGISDHSPFWYLYECSEELGDSWSHIASGQGNWQCKTFTGTYLGRRVPVVGLPHLSRYTLAGKLHVVDWIKGLYER